MSLFTLFLRNDGAADDVAEAYLKRWFEPMEEITDDPRTGGVCLDGREGVAVWIASGACLNLWLGNRNERLLNTYFAELPKATFALTKSRFVDLLPLMIQASKHSDVALASAACWGISCWMHIKTSNDYKDEFLASNPARVAWDVRRRVVQPGLPATQWREQAQSLSLHNVCHTIQSQGISTYVSVAPAIPHDGVWPEIISECVHVARVNAEAELMAQERFAFYSFFGLFSIINSAARDPAYQPTLMPCAEALL